jgi:ferredoxin
LAKRIKIDQDLCSGYALCLDAAPAVFDINEHDVAFVIDPAQGIEQHQEAIERAIKLCPLSAISFEDDEQAKTTNR